ncbi:MAG: type methionyl aminopeptidase [Actinomycetota bacterium]|jgi:methionyl aminopeptidase
MRKKFELKTEDQIRRMRVAGLLTAKALENVRAAIVPGVTTLELDQIAEQTIRDGGGRPNFQLVPGYYHTICASINSEVVHGIPSNKTLQPGDLISIDCGAEVDGWNGDSAFSMVVPGGDAELAARRQLQSDVCEGSLWAGIAALAKAKRLNEVGVAIEDYIAERGSWGILEQYVGHGIGRSMHEDPAVFNYRVRDAGPKVEPGLCLAIEPMITSGKQNTSVAEDDWTVVTRDGGDGAHWEHSVAVHSKGIWVLTAPDGGVSGLARFGVTPISLD